MTAAAKDQQLKRQMQERYQPKKPVKVNYRADIGVGDWKPASKIKLGVMASLPVVAYFISDSYWVSGLIATVYPASMFLIAKVSKTPMLQMVKRDLFVTEPVKKETKQRPPIVAEAGAERAPQKQTERMVTTPQRLPPQQGLHIGRSLEGEHAVYLDYLSRQLKNRMVLILGGSGGGKTYLLQRLLMELSKLIPASSVVFDFKPSFRDIDVEPEFDRHTRMKNHFLAESPVSINPLAYQETLLSKDRYLSEDAFAMANRVASTFKRVYTSFGEQQSATLAQAIEDGIRKDAGFNLSDLSHLLRKTEVQYSDDGSDKRVPVYKHGGMIANKLDPFLRANVFKSGESAWDTMLNDKAHRVHVLQLHGLDEGMKKLVAEFLLWDLYGYLTRTGREHVYRPVVVDECHNSPATESSPLWKFLKEGRAFGASMFLATQNLIGMSDIERATLLQAATIFVFQPVADETKSFANMLRDRSDKPATYWAKELSLLQLGECFMLTGNRIEKIKVAEI